MANGKGLSGEGDIRLFAGRLITRYFARGDSGWVHSGTPAWDLERALSTDVSCGGGAAPVGEGGQAACQLLTQLGGGWRQASINQCIIRYDPRSWFGMARIDQQLKLYC